jgi:hypothetical protein
MRGALATFGIKALVAVGSLILSVMIVYSIFWTFLPSKDGIEAMGLTLVYGLIPVILLTLLIGALILKLMDHNELDQPIEEQEVDLSLREEGGGPGSANDKEGPTDYYGMMRYNRGIDHRDGRRK